MSFQDRWGEATDRTRVEVKKKPEFEGDPKSFRTGEGVARRGTRMLNEDGRHHGIHLTSGRERLLHEI